MTVFFDPYSASPVIVLWVCSLSLSVLPAQTQRIPSALAGQPQLQEQAQMQKPSDAEERSDGVVASPEKPNKPTFQLEVEAALGGSGYPYKFDERDIQALKAVLRTTFQTLPRNKHGNLGENSVRYALNRLFLARHGWSIRGLDQVGGDANTSFPSQVQLPSSLGALFEKRLTTRGLDLDDIVILAAAIETLAHKEELKNLDALFRMYRISYEAKVSVEEIDFLLDIYLAAHLLGTDITKKTREQLIEQVHEIQEIYPQWREAQKFAHGVRQELCRREKGAAAGQQPRPGEQRVSLNFSRATAVVAEIAEQFGRWRNSDCQVMKRRLTELEDKDPGCVSASSFYKGMQRPGDSKIAHLRQLGVLDESDLSNVRIVSPNFLSSVQNCVQSSKYYSVCCQDECEELVTHIERRVRVPAAPASQLLSIVAALPSSTVRSNRTLTLGLPRRLEKIAKLHGGLVPIHSRLFRQWLHEAYPRECGYPHNWFNLEVDAGASIPAQMKNEKCGQWRKQEELLQTMWQSPGHLPSHVREEMDVHPWAIASCFALLTGFTAVLLTILHTCRSMPESMTALTKRLNNLKSRTTPVSPMPSDDDTCDLEDEEPPDLVVL
mmetsp:Transcript_122521/g.212575  ORF Transcript_122521/g.212575 Transcript_122521/m.212575 type:complete len:607 (+) Transcript_122521:125-1945(+)